MRDLEQHKGSVCWRSGRPACLPAGKGLRAGCPLCSACAVCGEGASPPMHRRGRCIHSGSEAPQPVSSRARTGSHACRPHPCVALPHGQQACSGRRQVVAISSVEGRVGFVTTNQLSHCWTTAAPDSAWTSGRGRAPVEPYLQKQAEPGFVPKLQGADPVPLPPRTMSPGGPRELVHTDRHQSEEAGVREESPGWLNAAGEAGQGPSSF